MERRRRRCDVLVRTRKREGEGERVQAGSKGKGRRQGSVGGIRCARCAAWSVPASGHLSPKQQGGERVLQRAFYASAHHRARGDQTGFDPDGILERKLAEGEDPGEERRYTVREGG